MLAYREQIKSNFKKKEKSLLEKKEKLFVQKDISKWGCSKEMMDELKFRKDQILQDKDRAFTFMMAEETGIVLSLQQELNYITNQCLDEARRVGKDNGDLLIDHFLTMSQIKCAYYTMHHGQWADFAGRLQESQEDKVEIRPLQSTNLKQQMASAL